MAVTVYRSTDTSAPILTGEAGKLIALLDACLVNGYGSKVAAGWTKPYSGTSAAVYRIGGSAPQFYLDVNDNGLGLGTFKEARLRGYETMTAVATGTGPFPNIAQSAAQGRVVRKSVTADAVARAWLLVADARTFYLFIQTGDSAGSYSCSMFGEMYSMLPSDGYRYLLIGRNSENSGIATPEQLFPAASIQAGQGYLARGYTGIGDPVTSGLAGQPNWVTGTAASGWAGVVPFPNPTDGGLYLSRIYVHEAVLSSLRGYLRGFYQQAHPAGAFADGDTFSGMGEFAGRTFMIVKNLWHTNAGAGVIETSAWDTNA